MARFWNSFRHFASIKAIPDDSICRRDDHGRFAIDSPVSVAPCGAREGLSFDADFFHTSSSLSIS
jgi:hypothetical protein